MKFFMTLALPICLMGCQTQAVKEQPYKPDPSKIEHVKIEADLEASMATLDMAEFARRH